MSAFVFQVLAGAAAAAPAVPMAAPSLPEIEPVPVPPPSLADPALAAALPPTYAEVAADSPQDAIRQLTPHPTIPGPQYDVTPEEALAESQGPQPLADTDNNDINDARQMNGASQWTGESINGRAVGMFSRDDVDWWWFPMGNVSLGTADVFEFDVQKEAGEYMFVNIYYFASFDPDNYAGAPGNPSLHQVFYDTMNNSQGWGVNTHVKVTAFEAGTYFLYLVSPRRNGCCMVNYTLTNVTDYTIVSDPAVDDNSNTTSADVFNGAAMPTNQEVEQNADYVDVYDLTAQFGITPANGDYSQVTVNVSLVAGRNGISDFRDTRVNPEVTSEGDTLSYATLWILYPDPRGIWHTITTSGIPGDTLRFSQLINGTPFYAAVTVTSLVNIPGLYPGSSVPGWMRYSFVGFSHLDDRAPDFVPQIPNAAMWEDNPSSGADLIDMAPYFTDDRDTSLWFSVKYNQFPTSVTLSVNGRYLSVSVVPANWWGNVTIQVLGHDWGMDRVSNTPDDHATSSNFFVVNVQPVNDPPAITALGGQANLGSELVFTVAQGGFLSLTPTIADVDGATGFAYGLSSTPSWATFFVSNGTATFSPGNADVGTVHLIETVSDGAAQATVSFRIDVTNVNDNPRFVAVGGVPLNQFPHTFTATQGVTFSLRLEVADPDWEIGVQDSLNYAADRTFFTLAAETPDSRFALASFVPTNAQVGLLTVTFSVTDGALGAFDDNVTVSISVQNANDAPRMVSVSTTSDPIPVPSSHWVNYTGFDGGHQDVQFTMTVRADDIDVSAGHGDVLTFSTSLPNKFLVVLNPDGFTAEISFTPNQTDATRGYVQVDIIVTDAGAVPLFDTLRMWISVENRPDPPVWTPVFSLNLTEDVNFAYAFEAVDPDGDRITYSSDSPLFAIDPVDGTVDFTPTNELINGEDMEFELTLTARDPGGKFSITTVHIFIRNVNDRPSGVRILAPSDGSESGPGEALSFLAEGSDPDAFDASGLTFIWYADGTEMARGKSAVFAIANPNAAQRTVEITLEVSDSHGAFTNDTITVNVRGTAAPPKSPGFEGVGAVLALGAVVAIAAVAARRRK